MSFGAAASPSLPALCPRPGAIRGKLEDIAKVVVGLLSATGVEAEDHQKMVGAVELAREKNVDFIDAHLALRAAGNDEDGCTFDKSDFKALAGPLVDTLTGRVYPA